MKLKYTYAMQSIAGSFMAIALDGSPKVQNTVLRLNEVGKDIMELLKEDLTEDELIAKLKEQYEGDDGYIRQCVGRFLAELREKDLLA